MNLFENFNKNGSYKLENTASTLRFRQENSSKCLLTFNHKSHTNKLIIHIQVWIQHFQPSLHQNIHSKSKKFPSVKLANGIIVRVSVKYRAKSKIIEYSWSILAQFSVHKTKYSCLSSNQLQAGNFPAEQP